MPSYDGEAFRTICRIAEGVRQRLMHNVELHRVGLGAEVADKAMVDVEAASLGVDRFEDDCELLYRA